MERLANRLCRLVFAGLAASTIGAAHADSTVRLTGTALQRIDGFGASDAWLAGGVRAFSPTVRARILDTLFSPASGAGLSLLRHRVPYAIEPSQGVWDWTQDGDSIWLQHEAEQRGVVATWSTVWSPPAWMKSNGDVNNGGYVLPEHYQDYADYLAAYLKQYHDLLGADISGVSIQNEPDITASYESCLWSSQQFHDFIKYFLKPTFRAANIHAKVIMPERSGWFDDYAYDTLNDPDTASFVDVVAAHQYWGTIQPFTDATAEGKTVWETEVSNLGQNDPSINDGLYWAEMIHHTLVDAQANAWHYWWLYCDSSFTSTGQSLILGDSPSNTFFVNKRLWTIGNFSRFVRPGCNMVGVSSNYPESGVFVSAFGYGSSAQTVVAINANNWPTGLTVQGLGKGLGAVNAYRTSTTENLSFAGSQLVPAGMFSFQLDPMSVTTFVRSGPAVP